MQQGHFLPIQKFDLGIVLNPYVFFHWENFLLSSNPQAHYTQEFG